MGRLTERLGVARKALQTLLELPLVGEVSDIQRDAAIQRLRCEPDVLTIAQPTR